MSQRSVGRDAAVARHAPAALRDHRVDVPVAEVLRDLGADRARDRQHAEQGTLAERRAGDRAVAEAVEAVTRSAEDLELLLAVLERLERRRHRILQRLRSRRAASWTVRRTAPIGTVPSGGRKPPGGRLRSRCPRRPAPPAATSSAGTTRPTTAPSSRTSRQRQQQHHAGVEARVALDKGHLLRVVGAQQAVHLGDVALAQRTTTPNSSAEKRAL